MGLAPSNGPVRSLSLSVSAGRGSLGLEVSNCGLGSWSVDVSFIHQGAIQDVSHRLSDSLRFVSAYLNVFLDGFVN